MAMMTAIMMIVFLCSSGEEVYGRVGDGDGGNVVDVKYILNGWKCT